MKRSDENNIVIADPKVGDENILASIHKNAWLDTYPDRRFNITKKDILSKDFDSPEKISRWKDRIQNNKTESYLFVAKVNGNIVGYCSPKKESVCNRIGSIYILPEYQHMGIGGKLIRKAIKWLGKDKKICLKVAAYNKNAIGFYKKNGFMDIGITDPIELPSGKTVPAVWMELRKDN
jgi:ribosomal protein S18 acetylase RimI-like enzyme